jgi:uncharacterized protein (DUF58 family)
MAEVWIFLDADRNVHNQNSNNYETPKLNMKEVWRPFVSIPLPASTEEYAVCAAASLARYYLRNGRVVGFASAGKNLWVISSDRGARQLGKILETLALLKSDGNLPLQALWMLRFVIFPEVVPFLIITLLVKPRLHQLSFRLRNGGCIDCHFFRWHQLWNRTRREVGSLSVPMNIPVFRVKNVTIYRQFFPKGGKGKISGWL